MAIICNSSSEGSSPVIISLRQVAESKARVTTDIASVLAKIDADVRRCYEDGSFSEESYKASLVTSGFLPREASEVAEKVAIGIVRTIMGCSKVNELQLIARGVYQDGGYLKTITKAAEKEPPFRDPQLYLERECNMSLLTIEAYKAITQALLELEKAVRNAVTEYEAGVKDVEEGSQTIKTVIGNSQNNLVIDTEKRVSQLKDQAKIVRRTLLILRESLVEWITHLRKIREDEKQLLSVVLHLEEEAPRMNLHQPEVYG